MTNRLSYCLRALALGLFLLTESLLAADNCKVLEAFNSQHLQYKNSTSPLSRSKNLSKLKRIETGLATSIVRGFYSKQVSNSFFKKCIKDNKYQNLKDKISEEFKEQFKSQLSSSQTKGLQKLSSFVEVLDRKFVLYAKVSGERNERVAEYHRMNRSIYYNVDRLPSNELTLIQIHEVLHKYDEEVLYKTSTDYSNITVIEYLHSLAQSNSSFESLTGPEKIIVKRYILNGLRRGLLAEFKVWAASYRIYNEMLAYNEIKKISWADNVLLGMERSQNYLDYIFSYYEPRFKRPEKKYLFRWDLYQEAYDVVIKEIYSIENKCSLMDDLSVFITECN